MLRREGLHHRDYPCVNKQIAGRTREGWCVDNKDKMIEYRKIYYENKKEQRKNTLIQIKNK
jgi:hypothetical protein